MKQRRQPTFPISNAKPAEPSKAGKTSPMPLDPALLKDVAGGVAMQTNRLPVKGW